jgi:hypothetical protein
MGPKGLKLFDLRIFLRASLVGVILHVALVVLEAVIPAFTHVVGLEGAMYAAMMISGMAGLLYARDLDKGFSPGALGGLGVGMISAFAGLALAGLLGTRQVFPLGLGTVIGTGIGAVGGVFGQMSANIRKVTGKF